MDDVPYIDHLRTFILPDDVPDGEFPSIVRFLTEKYGSPDISAPGSDIEMLEFPGSGLKILRDSGDGDFIGAIAMRREQDDADEPEPPGSGGSTPASDGSGSAPPPGTGAPPAGEPEPAPGAAAPLPPMIPVPHFFQAPRPGPGCPRMRRATLYWVTYASSRNRFPISTIFGPPVRQAVQAAWTRWWKQYAFMARLVCGMANCPRGCDCELAVYPLLDPITSTPIYAVRREGPVPFNGYKVTVGIPTWMHAYCV